MAKHAVHGEVNLTDLSVIRSHFYFHVEFYSLFYLPLSLCLLSQQARIWHRLPISWLPTGCYPEPHLLHCDCTL